jgi:tetratricopeptide (TPR) repeat protein
MRASPIATLAALALLAGCAQQPAVPLAARQAAAVDASRAGDALMRRAEFDGAARQYAEALRIARSIEDAEGIAISAINLSIALQRLGKSAEARASLEPLLDQPRLAFAPLRQAQAALRRAVLDLDEKRYQAANEWLDKAAAWCGPQACGLAASIHNARGLIALEEGRAAAAAASARLALDASRLAGDRIETANALRLLGNAAIRAGDAAAALPPLAEALAVDRELALPQKIQLDLTALGRASALAGQRDAAHGYYARALAVSEAERDAQGAEHARALMRELSAQRQSGSGGAAIQ